MTTQSQHLIRIKALSWPGILLSGLGGFIFLMSVILAVVPKENPPPFPGAQYVPLAFGGVLLAAGIYFLMNAKVVVELTTNSIKLPGLTSPLPLKEISQIDYLKVKRSDGAIRAYVVMMLTEAGRSLVATTASPEELQDLDPAPDFCEEFDYFSYGPHESAEEFIGEVVRRRDAAQAGEQLEAVPEIPLVERDLSETGDSARAYVHDLCGQATLVSGSSFYWVVNPMRFSGSGTICVSCGQVMDETVHWPETGESITKFRSRMWKHTPASLKVTQFLVVPLIVGAIAMIFAPGAANVPVVHRRMIALGIGFMGTNMLVWMSPLAGILPRFFGMKYNRYL